MKPYWKSFDHILAFALAAVSHTAFLVYFSIVIANGVSIKQAGGEWSPSSVETSITMILLLISLGLFVVFLVGLILFIKKKKKRSLPETKAEPSICRGETASSPKARKRHKGEPLYVIPCDKREVHYPTVFSLFLRCYRAMFILTSILGSACIGVLIYDLIKGEEGYLIVMLSIAIGLSLVALGYMFIVPAFLTYKNRRAEPSTCEVYEDQLVSLQPHPSLTTEKEIDIPYPMVFYAKRRSDCFALLFHHNGKKTMLLLPYSKALTDEVIAYIFEKAEL